MPFGADVLDAPANVSRCSDDMQSYLTHSSHKCLFLVSHLDVRVEYDRRVSCTDLTGDRIDSTAAWEVFDVGQRR